MADEYRETVVVHSEQQIDLPDGGCINVDIVPHLRVREWPTRPGG